MVVRASRRSIPSWSATDDVEIKPLLRHRPWPADRADRRVPAERGPVAPRAEAPPDGVRLIAPNLRGFRGLAEAPRAKADEESLTMADYAGDVLELMDRLGRSATRRCAASRWADTSRSR